MTAVTYDLRPFLPQHITINHCQHNYWPSLCIAHGFSPFQVKTVFFFLSLRYTIRLRQKWKTHTMCFRSGWIKRKENCDIFNLRGERAECCERLDAIPLLLQQAREGKAPLLNASVLTSIMTVSRIEKPSRQISFSTHWWLTVSVKWLLMPCTPSSSKGMKI